MTTTKPQNPPSSPPHTFAPFAPFFPPLVTHAEDQPYARSALTTHVLHRGFQSGALLTLTYTLARTGLRARTAPAPVLQTFKAAAPSILRTTGAGALAGTALMVIALPMRMRGREDIEWRDRTWRLAHNKGQREVDGWALVGEVGGLAGGLWAVSRGVKLGALGVLGAAAAGNVVGVEDYMVWRYGVNRGRRAGDEN